MCLYETKIKNNRYRPTIKNLGKVPECKDTRQLYINVGCGWCKECRKKLANEWRVRLQEEIKDKYRSDFITLSFSPESIQKLEEEIKQKKWHGFEGNELDVNILAAYAVRMWAERWRKINKKSPRHWLITELGQQNSERLHLHGLIINTTGKSMEEFRKCLISTWKYGNITIGKYKEWDKKAITIGSWVNCKTINYVIKYVLKIDKNHKGYRQKIFTSKCMGDIYLEKNRWKHEFIGEKTNTTYMNEKGYKYSLPRHYKMKLWNDEQRQMLWTYALNERIVYVDGMKCELTTTIGRENLKNGLEGIRATNELAGYGNHDNKNYKYIITEAMKLKKNELINYDTTKLVKRVERRKIKEIHFIDKDEKIDSKASRVKWYRFGEYIGSTTEAERKRNEEMKEAQKLLVSVRELRLIKAGIKQNTEFIQENKQFIQ